MELSWWKKILRLLNQSEMSITSGPAHKVCQPFLKQVDRPVTQELNLNRGTSDQKFS